MNKLKIPLLSVLVIYAISFVFRFVEYFYFQTDRTFWGEAFIHKLIGIGVLCIAVRLYSFQMQKIGFTKKNIFKYTLQGLLFGFAMFVVAYGVELAMVAGKGGQPTLQLYVSTYGVGGNFGSQTGLLFFAICILGNIINVVMEEGIFRGLFQKLLEQKYRFIAAAVIASVMFGVWHIIGPIRQFVEGGSMGGMLSNIAMLVTTSTLVGFQFALLTKLTGSLYMAMGAHFINNAIVNMLHVVSVTGADELMVVRITIAQMLSFVVVILIYLQKCGKENEVFH